MPRKAWGGLPIDSQNEILSKIFLFYAIKDTGGSRGVSEKSPRHVNARGQLEVAPGLS